MENQKDNCSKQTIMRGIKRWIALYLAAVLLVISVPSNFLLLADEGSLFDILFGIKDKQENPIPGAWMSISNSDGFNNTVSSNNEGEVVITGMKEGNSYQYSVSANDYEPNNGEVTVDQNVIVKGHTVTLYANMPVITEHPQNQTITVGDPVSFSITVSGGDNGNMLYQWYRNNEAIDGETNDTLHFDHVMMGDNGDIYCCVVSSVLQEDPAIGVSSGDAQLTVNKATPELNIQIEPISDSLYSGESPMLTASVIYPEYVGQPSGNVNFYIDNELVGTDQWKIGSSLVSAGDVAPLTSDQDHSIYAEYVGDDQYEAVRSDTIMYRVAKISPEGNIHYEVNEPNGENGWYKGDGQVEITPKGLFNKIGESMEGAWSDILRKPDETVSGGDTATFYLHNTQTGEISNEASISYKLDRTAPNEIELTKPTYETYDDELGKYSIIFSAIDPISGVEAFSWEDHTGAHTVSANETGTTIDYLTAQQYKTLRNLSAVDKAGNSSAAAAIRNQAIDVQFSAAAAVTDVSGNHVQADVYDHNSRFYYTEDNPETVTLRISNPSFNPEQPGLIITVNSVSDGDVTQIVKQTTVTISDWQENVSDGTFTGSFTIDEDGAYIIAITADGYSIFSEEYEGNVSNNSYYSNVHIVDTVAPRIDVTYGSDTTPNKEDVYGEDRPFTIVVSEQNFRPDELTFLSFEATDSQGNPIDNIEQTRDNLLAAIKEGNWIQEGNKHTSAQFMFSEEANYAFTIGYADLAGNTGEYIESTKFTIDKTKPIPLKVTYETSPVGRFFQMITFGLYEPTVTVTLAAEDATSGVDYFTYTYIRQEGVSTTLNVPIQTQTLTDITYSNGSKLAEASFTLTANESKQYRGNIAFTVVDKAGNTSENYNDNLTSVIDTIAPLRTVTFSEPTQIRDRGTYAPYEGDKAVYVNEEGTNAMFYYKDEVTIHIAINEANFYSETTTGDRMDDPYGLSVKVNGTEQTLSWTKDPNQADIWNGSLTISQAGRYEITIDYTDISGNKMIPYTSNTIFIDGTSPTIERVVFTPKTADGVESTNTFINNLEYGFYFKTAFTASVIVSDADPSSGLDRVTYQLFNHGNREQPPIMSGTAGIQSGVAVIDIPGGFKGQIVLDAIDRTENHSGEKATMGVVVDNSAPSIQINTSSTTPYKDAVGNSLYVSDVSITARISDPISGIKSIGYQFQGEKNSYERKVIQIGNTGHRVGQDLGDGWVIVAMDANLVTEVRKVFGFGTDNNDMRLIFDATDRTSNSVGNRDSERFTVDKTAPVINVVFRGDDDTDEYYDDNRIADISVIERNFDASRIITEIENTYGNIPTYSFQEVSNTEHTAVINFDEGDYQFDINGMDLGDQIATVNFSGGNEKQFYVDKTLPTLIENFDSFIDEQTENSFRIDLSAVISISEHNFDPMLTGLRVYRKSPGADHTRADIVDVTSDFVGGNSWITVGDMHTISLLFSEDGVYQVEITPTDLSGNLGESKSTVVFEIDTTDPILEQPVDKTAYVYKGSITEEPAKEIVFEDHNIDKVIYTITAYQYVHLSNDAYNLEKINAIDGEVEGDTVNLPADLFRNDGIYEVKATAYDVAGNNSGAKVYTYVVMRETEMMAYIPKDSQEAFHNIGKRAIDFDSIPILVYIANDARFDIKIGDTLVSESDYEIVSTREIVNQVTEYHISIPDRYIVNTFYEDNQVYDMPINVINTTGQLLTLGRMIIDNVKPYGEFEVDLTDGKGFYGVSERQVQIVKLSDNIDKDATTVTVNDENIPFSYDEAARTITFTLPKSDSYGHPWAGYTISATLVSTAGNEYALTELHDIYVGNWFGRWWIEVAGAGAVLTSGLTIGIVQMIKTKKVKTV
jgi:hypothetical protein